MVSFSFVSNNYVIPVPQGHFLRSNVSIGNPLVRTELLENNDFYQNAYYFILKGIWIKHYNYLILQMIHI